MSTVSKNRLLSFFFKNKKAAPRCQRNKARLNVEALEDRLLLDTAGGFSAMNGVCMCSACAGNRIAETQTDTSDAGMSVNDFSEATTSNFSKPTPPIFHSNPSAPYTIFLDFGGHVVSGTSWNQIYNNNRALHFRPFSLDNDFSTFSSLERQLIEDIWKRVAEDFAPFNVNVTTQDPGLSAFTAGSRAIRVLITATYDDASMGGSGKQFLTNRNIGGEAFMNSWTLTSDTPALVYYDNILFVNNNLKAFEKNVADTISHEVGHTVGLDHSGKGSLEYWGGHGSGATGWAPIMGPFNNGKPLTQWSNGDYADATSKQDQVAIIANRFGLRPDDHGNTNSTATQLTVSAGNVNGSGIIGTRFDVDVFSFTTSGGRVELKVSPFEYWDGKANLDVLARLYDSSGRLITTSNPPDQLFATFDITLSSGTYFLYIEGTGRPGYYSDYGSLGQYTITGTVPGATVSDEPATATLIGPSGTINTTTPTFRWNAAANATWYQVYVYNNDARRVVLNQWVENATSLTHNAALAEGNYTFWVMTWGNGKYGQWSQGMDFRVQIPGPATATLIGPGGTINTTTPTFRWNAANNATWYYVYVYNNDTRRVVLTQWVENATSLTLTRGLAEGSYTFWVQTWGNGRYGDWSQGMDFRVQIPKPATATLIGPSGSTSSRPTFQWNAATNATWYRLYVYNHSTGRVVLDGWLEGSTSYTVTSNLSSGYYTFWVQTWGNGKYGDWSYGLDFTIF